MSMLLMVKAMQMKIGSPARKLVLIKLADNANDKGECWPSYRHIADHCEMSRRSVISHVNKLCLDGLLRKQYRKGVKGNSSNMFYISLDSANISPPSENHSPPPSENISPRISHSLEPVNEPCSFDGAWEMYERKGNKKTSSARFKKLSIGDKKLLLDHVPKYIASKPDKQYRKDFERYISNECWNDEIQLPANRNNTNSEFEGFN